MDEPELDPRQKARQESYKAGASLEAARRKRDETTISLRKAKKNEKLLKKRQMGTSSYEEKMVAQQAGYDAATERIERLDAMMEALASPDMKEACDACMLFRKLLSLESNPPIDLIIQAGAVPYFVSFLTKYEYPPLQFEAAWALTNIASGQPHQTAALIEYEAIGPLVALLQEGSDEVREQVVWCLGNVAGDSCELRDLVLEAGAMEPLLANLSAASKPSMMRNGTWMLSNLCRGKPPPEWSLVSPSLRCLARLIFVNDDDVLMDALWALSYLSDGSDARIQQVIDAGVVRRTVELLTISQPNVQIPALRTVGNIVTGNDVQTQTVINSAVLPCLLFLLSSPKENIKKEACWTISNITAGSKHQIKAVIDAGLVPALIEILETSEYFKTRREAAWALSNMTTAGNPEHIRLLVTRGIIKPFVELLKINDARVMIVAMEGLENILKIGELDARRDGFNAYAVQIEEHGGMNYLFELQKHPNRSVYERANAILSMYFSGDEDGEVNDGVPVDDEDHYAFVAPQAPQGGYRLGGAAPGAGFGAAPGAGFGSAPGAGFGGGGAGFGGGGGGGFGGGFGSAPGPGFGRN